MKNKLSFPVLGLILMISTACVLPATHAPEYQSQSNVTDETFTATVQASNTRLPSATLAPSKTLQPSRTPTIRIESTPTPFEVDKLKVSKEDRMTVVEDVTYPDGSVFKPNTLFIKTWRVENTGTSTWNRDYLIVHAKENTYSGPMNAKLMFYPVDTDLGWNIGSWPEPLTEVKPGEIVDISILVQAPNDHGYQIAIWNLVNDRGERFEKPLWSQIQVEGTIPPEQLGWNGSWLVNDPFLNDPQTPITFTFETSDQWTHGYFYNTFGQLNLISGNTGSDQLILDGLYGKPNQRVGGTPLFLQLSSTGLIFRGTIWHEDQTQRSMCGARDEESYIENCLPKEIKTHEPTPTPE
jgi:hypothetical protein